MGEAGGTKQLPWRHPKARFFGAGHILRCLREGVWKRVLFAATGALMSPTTTLQGESIPGICHAVAIENVRC